jgi:phosphate transport system permease protein
VTVTTEARRRTGGYRRSDALAVAGAAGAALAVTRIAYGAVFPVTGPLAYAVTTYALFLAGYALLVSFDETGPAVRDRIAGLVVRTLAALVLLGLVFVVWYTVARGQKALVHSNFYTHDMRAAGPLDDLRHGGMAHAALGTLEQIGLATLFTVPLGLTCAVFLTEMPGRFSRFVRTVVEAMTALPSVVAGLFVYATLLIGLHWHGFTLRVEKSGIAAAAAISVVMLPVVIRTADVILRLVPGSLKEASYALGASHWRTLWRVTLPTARPGLTTAVILGVARGIGETAPVLLTAGFAAGLNTNPLHGVQASLPTMVFQSVRSSSRYEIARGFGSGAALLALVLFLFVLARVVSARADRRFR